MAEVKKVCTVIPYPVGISVNHCWKRVGNRTYLEPGVRRYRDEVYLALRNERSFNDGAVRLEIGMFPPDKRRRDIDNILKVVLDSLVHASLIEDDSQIMQLYVEKHPPVKDGRLELTVISL